jgi:hypothetical protein
MSISKNHSRLFGQVQSKEERIKIRSKSIAILKLSKFKSLNSKINSSKNSTGASKIFAKGTSPVVVPKYLKDINSPKILNFTNSMLIKRPGNPKDQLNMHIDASILKKSSIPSNRKKIAAEINPYSICIEEAPSTDFTASTFKPSSGKLNLYPCKFLSSSQLEKFSANRSFHSQNSTRSRFRDKVGKIFAKFKKNHLDIIKRFKSKK